MTAIDDPGAPAARNPRREAQEVAGDGFDARVLEPSPPAVTDGELADPDAAGPEATAQPVAAPVPSTDPTAARPDGFWNAGSFRGGILGLGELVDAPDQRAAALRFLRRGRELLRD